MIMIEKIKCEESFCYQLQNLPMAKMAREKTTETMRMTVLVDIPSPSPPMPSPGRDRGVWHGVFKWVVRLPQAACPVDGHPGEVACMA
jgi:hypothetical protein